MEKEIYYTYCIKKSINFVYEIKDKNLSRLYINKFKNIFINTFEIYYQRKF